MTSQSTETAGSLRRKYLLLVAWVGTLLVSTLPLILWREVLGKDASGFDWVRLGLALLVVVLTLLWREARPLFGYFLLLFVIHIVAGIVNPLVAESALWQAWFGGDASWAMSNLGVHLLGLFVSLVVLAVLTLRGMKPAQYFLVKGQSDAPVEPVRWLGIRRPEPWRRFGPPLAAIITALTLLFLVSGIRPSWGDVMRALPFLPLVLVFAALNAFNEELPFRAALLSQLLPVVGKDQALWLTAILFGLGHFYGVPNGLPGVFMAGLLGYLLGKSMAETRGFFWAWFIHFLQDVVIFFFFAMFA
ncbi:MAG: CPBP family intramembrane metalloprotease [Anaerolineae bacterium]|nr:MAG: CPBP family intramembrane metalloprotease [Anaerolineae bacterium]